MTVSTSITPVGAELPLLAKFLMMANGGAGHAAILAEHGKAPSRVQTILKASVGAGALTDPTWAGNLADFRIVSAGFIETLRARSAFVRIFADGLVRVPLRTRIISVTATVTATEVAENAPTPVGRLSLAGQNLPERKAEAVIVVSSELVMSSSAAAVNLIGNELRSAVAAALDGRFFVELLSAGATAIASTGVTAAQITADLRAMLMAANATGSGKLFWVAPAAVANGLSTVTGTDGALAFPTVSPQGGELLGLPLLVSAGTGAADNFVLVDATGIVGDIDTITLDVSEHAAVQMDSAPTNPPTASTVMTSLWQTNCIAMKAAVWFGVERVRNSAVAVLTGIDWTP